MNRPILNPFTLRKRFVIIIAVMLAMFAAVGLIACGDNDIPTGGNPPSVSGDSLLFSLDSFSIRSSSAGVTVSTLTDTALVSFDSLKITFDMSTNITNDSTSIGLFLYDGSPLYIEIPLPHNGTYTLYHKQYNESAMRFIIYLRFTNPDNTAKYLKVSNFKIYKLKIN